MSRNRVGAVSLATASIGLAILAASLWRARTETPVLPIVPARPRKPPSRH